ncbi:class I SAM-dependent DNA methyltransferase [Streptomyces sp. NPDC127197]|uniref:class I SAM-dependent DNA methyltransferase n=1 Tax=Streptomyces sp. NPDC127197 TaxID=3345388 RepID=UPI0036354523
MRGLRSGFAAAAGPNPAPLDRLLPTVGASGAPLRETAHAAGGAPAAYDGFADTFAAEAAVSAYNAHYDRPTVLRLLADVRDRRVLDAGCGAGLYLAELVERGAKVTGFDQSARHGPSRRARVAALRELHRVLRRAGRLVLSTSHPTADWLADGGSCFDARHVEETWTGGMLHRYWRQPLERWVEEITEAGFTIERLGNTDPPRQWPKPHPGNTPNCPVSPDSSPSGSRRTPCPIRPRPDGTTPRTGIPMPTCDNPR